MYGKISIKLFIVALTTLCLGLLGGGTIILLSLPASAHANSIDSLITSIQPDPPPARPHLANLSLTQSGASTVYNGDWITYTLTIVNDGATVKEIYVEDQLPSGVFAELECLTEVGNCTVEVVTTSVVIRTGNTVVVSQPVKIKWTFVSPSALTLPFPLILKFRGRVLCQPVGSRFDNQATLTYKRTDDTLGFSMSTPLFINTTVVQPPITQEGHFSLSTAPELCTQNGPIGGASDMDWGDFDNDGDLDLALVSWDDGIFVYRNQGQGQFEFFWNDDTYSSETIQWVDVDGNSNGYLELVVGGDYKYSQSLTPDGGTYSVTGKNHLYRYNGNTAFIEYDQFDTNDGSWRIAAADYSGDGYPDLAVLNYWGGCTVHLYKNDQTGKFNRSDPANTTDSYCLLGPPYDFTASAHSAAWGDVDNDGDPDLAVGHNYTNGSIITTLLRIYKNNGGGLTQSNNITVENISGPAGNFSYAWDLAWGDYDGDGNLDLAAAFASTRFYDDPTATGGFRVYRNDGAAFSQVYSASLARAVGALAWADFNGDGQLELIIAEADTVPKIYQYSGGTFSVLQNMAIAAKGPVLAIRGIDFDNDADLDIAFTNFLAESWLFSNYTPFLQQVATGLVGSFVSYSVDWGDVNNDGYPDLLYGTNFATKLYHNQGDGTFFGSFSFNPNPLVRSAAFGDADNDGDLDMILGPNGQNLLYQNNGSSFSSLPIWITALSDNTYDQFFADINQDNLARLDLVVGNNGNANKLYINASSGFNATPTWQSAVAGSTYDIAWGYYDNDILPDLATADGDEGVRIYRNTGYDGFALAQTLAVSAARSVAWGDYDADGDMDLAVGRYNQPNLLYQNNNGVLSLIWTAPVVRNTTAVTWGDWNNDGDLDLAVGNYNQKDQVYDNLGSTGAQVNLAWLWEAAVNYKTTALRWIDYDNDGDLDLSLSQDSVNDPNGIYENSMAAAAHLVPNFSDRVLLPRVSPYISIQQPGNPNQLFKRSDLSISSTLTVPFHITVFDPDTSRQFNSNLNGNQIKIIDYQYSLNGGGQWYNATITPPLNIITPSRQGNVYTMQWQAGKDITTNTPNLAVSDDVRFRIMISQQNTPPLPYQIAGPTQRVVAIAQSPPFRVRNTSCIWPENAYIAAIHPTPPITPGNTIRLWGAAQQWDVHSTGITFTWDFGGVISYGTFMDHTYTNPGAYVVTMTVTQPPCPNTRPDFVTTTIIVTGTTPFTKPLLTHTIYLPLIQKSTGSELLQTGNTLLPLEVTWEAPVQVSNLRGETGPAGTTIRWNPSSSAEEILGYRVYRSKIGVIAFEQVADLPPSVTIFTDDASTCGYTYFVTAYNSKGESYPSTSSYYGPPCR